MPRITLFCVCQVLGPDSITSVRSKLLTVTNKIYIIIALRAFEFIPTCRDVPIYRDYFKKTILFVSLYPSVVSL